jgi:DDE superfamily endonuclease
VFEKHIAHRTKGIYRLLILDGHGSHVTPEFDLFSKEHSIITLCMPPHSSHLLQPLDVSCFAVLKRLYGRQVEQLIHNRVNHIDKQDFLEVYYTARIETMNQANIQSSFAAIGVLPYNLERVLAKLNTRL